MLRCWAYSLVATNKRNSQFRNFSAIGDSLYRQAEIYVQKHKENNDQVEARRQDEQYESQSGIRLVKSIVKQHRASKKIKDEQETNYLEKARACMEEAGLVHGHINALVSLANEILKS